MSPNQMRPYRNHSQTHGTALSPWTGRRAWWRSPTADDPWGAVLITVPASVLFTLCDWSCWRLARALERGV